MTGGVRFSILGGLVMLALAGCGRGFFQDAERAPWRREAEIACLQSGAVKLGASAVQIDPIEGPGVCGADFPLRVTALGEFPALGFANDVRPPARIPGASNANMPRWPASPARYTRPSDDVPAIGARLPAAPVNGERMRWVPGPPGIDRPQAATPASEPMSITPPDAAPMTEAPATLPAYQPRPAPQPKAWARPDDIPDDAVIPQDGSAAVPKPGIQPAYNAPADLPRRSPRLGPVRGSYNPAAMPQAAVAPPAKLACPMVSALDRWVSDGVQPAALHWFNSPVAVIHQIGSYSCRSMNGAGGHGISEHAFGNALDVSGFTLADGRKITVKDGWHGSPEEQGFLHDVQLYACETFETVLAPGYNAAHYNHFHVDLMRRASGRRPCRPAAIRGEIVAARARAHYAGKHGAPRYTGSVGTMVKAAKADLLEAIAGADGYVPDEDVTGSTGVAADAKNASKSRPYARWWSSRSPVQHTGRSGSEHPEAY
jgi:hypothetical protein